MTISVWRGAPAGGTRLCGDRLCGGWGWEEVGVGAARVEPTLQEESLVTSR